MKSIDRRTLQTDLLKRVSRSFYLSMRFLPKRMREPISLGYLLARASDTLADTALAPAELRGDSLSRFRGSLRETQADFPEFYTRVIGEFAPHQSHEGERELLQELPDLFEWLRQLKKENEVAVVDVMEKITCGQNWDLERFAGEKSDTQLAFCRSADELERYTYLVAGCVGEFWTRVGYLNLGEKFAPAAFEPDLMKSGRALGQGLQLVNILRDLGEDLSDGRCYLPADELREAGWDETSAAVPPESVLREVAEKWQKRCREFLSLGRDYVAGLRRGRVRFATALPLILAEATMDRVEAAGNRVLQEKIKVSRADVRRAMWQALRA